jgi:hypothetical protein
VIYLANLNADPQCDQKDVSRYAQKEVFFFTKNQTTSFRRPFKIYLPALEEDKIRHPGRISDQNRTGTDGTAAALPVQHTSTRGFHLHTYAILCDNTVMLLISTTGHYTWG